MVRNIDSETFGSGPINDQYSTSTFLSKAWVDRINNFLFIDRLLTTI